MRFAPGVKPGVMPKPMANNPRQVNPRQVTPGVSNPTGGPLVKPPPPGMASNLDVRAELGKRMGMKKGGKVTSASKRADGCAIRGKTRA